MCFSGVSVVVLILMILGTGYDYYIFKKITHKKNVIYDLEKHGKFDPLTNGNQKLNGKGFINQELFDYYIYLLLLHHKMK